MGGGTWTRGIVKNVYVMPVSGGAERKLLQVDGQGGIHAWSPDSRQLVVINDDKLVVVAATGGEPEVLATEQNFDGGLQWSLDGKRVLYTAYNPGPQSDIFAIDIAGGEPMNLTEDPKHYHCPPFSCSPDGKKVAYTKIEDDGDQHLWRFDLETGRKESLNTIAYNPVWSPDGNRIAFWSWRGEHICDIWALDVNTGQFQQITDDPDDKEDLAWSPDGNFIAFEITREDRQLWLMDLQ